MAITHATCTVEPLESRRLFDGGTPMQVLIETRFVEVSYTDSDGTRERIGLRDLGGTMEFLGTNLTYEVRGRRVDVSGEVNRISSIDISNSRDQSRMSFRGNGGDGIVKVGEVNFLNVLRSFDARNVSLRRELNVPGIRNLHIFHSDTAAINIGSMVPGVSFIGGDLVDTQITSAVGFKTIRVNQVSGSTSSLDAPYALDIKVKMGYEGNIVLELSPEPFRRASFGSIGAGLWSLSGTAGQIKADSILAGYQVDLDRLRSVRVRENASGIFNGRHIDDFRVGGDFVNGGVFLNDTFSPGSYAIDRFYVGGTVEQSVIDVTNSVHYATIGGMSGSTFYAGVGTGGPLPDSADDFADPAYIERMRIGYKPNSVGLVNSRLAAYRIETLAIKPLVVTSTPQVAAERIDVLFGATFLNEMFRQRNVATQTELVVFIRPAIILDF